MKKFIVISLLALMVFAPMLASAQASIPDARNTVLAGGPSGVVKLIKVITNWLFTILLVLAVVFIILAAYKYLMSGGGEEVGAAHKMVMYAAVAIAVGFLAKGIVFVVEELVTTGGSSGNNSGNGSLQIQLNTQNGGGNVNIPL
jgi:hypothetical protein